jgi:hypothetical protein
MSCAPNIPAGGEKALSLKAKTLLDDIKVLLITQ